MTAGLFLVRGTVMCTARNDLLALLRAALERGCHEFVRAGFGSSVLKLSLFAGALVAMSQNAAAQVPMGAGGQIQQIPQAPALRKTIPDLPIRRNETVTPPEAAGPKFLVASLHVTGQTRFSEAELIAATGFKPGSELS